MRSLILVVFLGLIVLAAGQTTSDTSSLSVSFSNSNSNSNSNTNSNSNSNSNSNTNSNSNSNSNSVTNTVTNTATVSVTSTVTVTNTNTQTQSNTISSTQSSSATVSRSATATVSVTNTNTPSPTGTGTATVTYPQPPAPTIGGNGCPNHIEFICPFWTDPAGFTFNLYRVYYQNTFTSVITVTTSTIDSLRIGPGLSPNTQYNVWVAGVDLAVGVWSANSTVVTFTTDPADPKKDPTLDIQNFACAKGTNPNTGRESVTCTWTAAQATVVRANIKARCVSSLREPTLVRKHLYGTAAQATSVFFAVNRDVGTCTFKARFYYARRPASRHVSVVTL